MNRSAVLLVALLATPGCGERETAAEAPTTSASGVATRVRIVTDDAGSNAESTGGEPQRGDDAKAEAAPAGAPDAAFRTAESHEEAREAARVVVARFSDEPGLAAHASTLRDHFGSERERADEARGGGDLELQTVILTRGEAHADDASMERTAALLARVGSRADGRDGFRSPSSPSFPDAGASETPPFLFALDAHPAARDARPRSRVPASSTIAWSKDVPLAGTFPGAREMALAGAPRGGVSVAWFDPTTRLVALRLWAFDGAVQADFVLGGLDACDAVSALYWPAQGWVVAASNLGQARLFVLNRSGILRFSHAGVDASLGREARAPLSLVPDTDDSIMIVGVGTSMHGARRAKEHVLALRLDASGERIWDAPVDLGPASPSAAKLAAWSTAPGVVTVDLGRGVVDVRSDAHVTRH